MITAAEARKLTDEILEPVTGSVKFKAIMAAVEHDIRNAIANGLECIEIVSYCLAMTNGYKLPKCINHKRVDLDNFWWPYVKEELEKNGFKVNCTITCNRYIVSW